MCRLFSGRVKNSIRIQKLVRLPAELVFYLADSRTCPPTGGFVCVCTLPLLMASPRFAATSNTPAIRYHFIPTRRVQELASCR
ncbi:MAG TPA: hypothetical protein PLE97_09745 [Tenuifilaceae bacterium]|nr:hypothetical protein [Tenuifilaceae bacterium]